MADDSSPNEHTTDQSARLWRGHAAQRAEERAGLTLSEILAYWNVSRTATETDFPRFATIHVEQCDYRVVVARHTLLLVIRDAVTEQPITIRTPLR